MGKGSNKTLKDKRMDNPSKRLKTNDNVISNKTNKKPKTMAKNVNKNEQEDDEANNLNNDFFVEDADDTEYDKIVENKQEDLEGSDLDYDDDDHVESISSGTEEEGTKTFTLTKEDFYKIKEKAIKGNNYAISQCINYFSKAIALDLSENIDEEEDNILVQKKYCLKIIKFCLKDLPQVIQLNPSKAIVKRLLVVIMKFLKNGDSLDQSLINTAFAELYKHINMIKMFKTYTEIFSKLAVKYWLKLNEDESKLCLYFLREMAISGESDFILKNCYLGFLSYAKTMNSNTKEKIENLMDNLVYLINQCDSESGYRNVFLFQRKLCIELNRTIMNKNWASIKNIYNWQVVNALILFNKILMNSYTCKMPIKKDEILNSEINTINNKDEGNNNSDFKLLSYPLVQLTIGVLRLHNVSNFIPLRLILIKQLILLSKISNIVIPVANYLIEILESPIFLSYYKDNIDKKTDYSIKDDANLTRQGKKKLKQKLAKKREKDILVKEKHILTNQNFNINDLPYTLKIKEYNYLIVKEIIQLVCKIIVEYCDIHSNSLIFSDIALPIITCLKRLFKKILMKEFKEIVKSVIEILECNVQYIHKKMMFLNENESRNMGNIGKIDLAIMKRFGHEIPIKVFLKKLEVKENILKEANTSRRDKEFININ